MPTNSLAVTRGLVNLPKCLTKNLPIWWLPTIRKPTGPLTPSLVCISSVGSDKASSVKTTLYKH